MRLRFGVSGVALLVFLWQAPPSGVAPQQPSARQQAEASALAALERLLASAAQAPFGFVGGRENGLEPACDVLRHGPTTPFEHEWMLAAAEVFADDFGLDRQARKHLEHALSRFPRDPELEFKLALTQPEGYTISSRPGVPANRLAASVGFGRVTPGTLFVDQRTIPRTQTTLERLATTRPVADEARAHLALLRFLRGDVTGALKDTGLVPESADTFTRNLASLVAGFSLDASGRRIEATSAFRRAVDALPEARGSALMLAAHVFLEGRRDEAAALLERAYAPTANLLDPWLHPVRDVRLVAPRVAAMRAMLNLPPAPRSETGRAEKAPRPLTSARDVAPDPIVPPSAAIVTPSRPQTPTTFRATAAGVVVDVSVRAGRNPVANLSAADFEILDNGIRQDVQQLEIGAVPLDVTLVLDTGESTTFAPDAGADAIRRPPPQAEADVLAIAGLLRPIDRLRVLAARTRPHEVLQMGLVSRTMGPMSFRWEGDRREPTVFSSPTAWSALYDTTAIALIPPTPADRRSLVAVFTDGIDATSIVTGDLLLAVAERSDALLHTVRRDTRDEATRARILSRGGDPRFLDPAAQSRNLLWPYDTKVLENTARATGGNVQRPSDRESSVDEFRKILDEFRQRYILRYQPTGVALGGWHQITVKVKRIGKFEVDARRGYFGGS